MCQILLFLEVEYVLEENTASLEIGKYALTHFVNEDVFSDKPTYPYTARDTMIS